VSFYKRKKGLLKKAIEISKLCGVKVVLCIVDSCEKVTLYSSEDLSKMSESYILPNIDDYLTSDIVILNLFSMKITSKKI
jgi:hypothetical protein